MAQATFAVLVGMFWLTIFLAICNGREVEVARLNSEFLASDIHATITHKQVTMIGNRSVRRLVLYDFWKEQYLVMDERMSTYDALFAKVEMGDTLEKKSGQMTVVIRNAEKQRDLKFFIK